MRPVASKSRRKSPVRHSISRHLQIRKKKIENSHHIQFKIHIRSMPSLQKILAFK